MFSPNPFYCPPIALFHLSIVFCSIDGSNQNTFDFKAILLYRRVRDYATIILFSVLSLPYLFRNLIEKPVAVNE